MAPPADRRDQILTRVADHLLASGLVDTGLRRLAAAAGTSDRMLLYYFADKAALLEAAFRHIAACLAAELAAAGAQKLPPAELLRALWDAFRAPRLAPYLRLWLELAAAAAGQQPHATVAHDIAGFFLAWIGTSLALPAGADLKTEATRVLAQLDGLMLLHAVGHGPAADATLC